MTYDSLRKNCDQKRKTLDIKTANYKISVKISVGLNFLLVQIFVTLGKFYHLGSTNVLG